LPGLGNENCAERSHCVKPKEAIPATEAPRSPVPNEPIRPSLPAPESLDWNFGHRAAKFFYSTQIVHFFNQAREKRHNRIPNRTPARSAFKAPVYDEVSGLNTVGRSSSRPGGNLREPDLHQIERKETNG
jgi:hypothetical protein